MASDILAGIAIVLSVVAIVVSVATWTRSRAIYGVKRVVLRQFRGDQFDALINDEKVNEMLKGGEYMIIGNYSRPADQEVELVLGRIKRAKKSQR